jgi:hypothetical protein
MHQVPECERQSAAVSLLKQHCMSVQAAQKAEQEALQKLDAAEKGLAEASAEVINLFSP